MPSSSGLHNSRAAGQHAATHQDESMTRLTSGDGRRPPSTKRPCWAAYFFVDTTTRPFTPYIRPIDSSHAPRKLLAIDGHHPRRRGGVAAGGKDEPLLLIEERETSPIDKSATQVLLASYGDGADASEARLWARHKNGHCSYGGRRTSRCPTGSECKARHACFVNPPRCRTAGQLCGAHARCCSALQCRADSGAHPVCAPAAPVWAPCAQSLAKVLVVGTPDNAGGLPDVKAKLNATGAFTTVDTFDAASGTPTLAYLQGYDAVLVFTDELMANTTLLGDNLADYRDGGGRAVVALFTTAIGYSSFLEGRWLSDGYNLFTPDGFVFSPQDGPLNFAEPTNPLLNGVTGLNATEAFRTTGNLQNGGVSVATWSDGTPLIVRGTKNGRQLVALNMYPPSADLEPRFWLGSGAEIMRNALLCSG